MKEQTFRMKELLQTASKMTQPAEDVTVSEAEFAEDAGEIDCADALSVTYIDVPKIIIPEIKDVYGRLSDIIDGIALESNISTVPLEMAGIAPEITKLQRHDIFELGGKRYAMSKVVREDVVKQYTNRVIKKLSNGLPFSENLTTIISYRGKNYRTFALSQREWTLLMSQFRDYKQILKIVGNTELAIEILAEKM